MVVWLEVCGCDCVVKVGVGVAALIDSACVCLWVLVWGCVGVIVWVKVMCVVGFVSVVMWAEMEIFMHMCLLESLHQSFTCVSPFSSLNSECSNEVSHYSDDSDVDSTDDSVEEDDNSDEESDLEGMAPTTYRRKVA